ncbi:MAG: NAD-dependent deacylase [Bacteroidales bacterium]|jgi:NAD-dependent deacetylase|nr:NAD-dependent deacylase [Bacteroidales bacterium]MDD2569567.1 NAD-dependent deacylase [Bacteroidales bacterium]MDD2813110.1 NAD-dependent deacylase [Bacteroidales bacterium]MDD3385741.1 NAD-dependent deacylase [Bacteroidales bacterium]MDD3811662.1 NAD-dependent deacylase [Bacteroidales bacterium]
MKRLIVLTGAGMSAESGLKTFRDMNGLWENYPVSEVATPEAWERNPHLVLHFYNERRKALLEAKPNAGHIGLAELEKRFDVTIITQNVDDLHERAGSRQVLHLHGELRKSRSTVDPSLIYDIDGWELKWGDKCDKGSQLRPHIVWFGEPVPMISKAAEIVQVADILVVIGTSMQVYPAAGLVDYAPRNTPIYYIDPNESSSGWTRRVELMQMTAGKGVARLQELLTDF